MVERPDGELEVLFTSWPDEETLVAEIWCEDALVGIVRSRESGLFVMLPRDGERTVETGLPDLVLALRRAQGRLDPNAM